MDYRDQVLKVAVREDEHEGRGRVKRKMAESVWWKAEQGQREE